MGLVFGFQSQSTDPQGPAGHVLFFCFLLLVNAKINQSQSR